MGLKTANNYLNRENYKTHVLFLKLFSLIQLTQTRTKHMGRILKVKIRAYNWDQYTGIKIRKFDTSEKSIPPKKTGGNFLADFGGGDFGHNNNQFGGSNFLIPQKIWQTHSQ